MSEVLLHDKIGVWCTINVTRIIRPIFFPDTINSETYVAQTLKMQVVKPEKTSAYSKMVQLSTKLLYIPFLAATQFVARCDLLSHLI